MAIHGRKGSMGRSGRISWFPSTAAPPFFRDQRTGVMPGTVFTVQTFQAGEGNASSGGEWIIHYHSHFLQSNTRPAISKQRTIAPPTIPQFPV
jgi:hypothetical protein